MTNEVHELIPAKHIKKPSYSLVCSWVKAAWEKVDSSLICKSFKCCEILVKINGTEDNEIFDYDNLIIDEDKENDENEEQKEDDEEVKEKNYNNWNEIWESKKNLLKKKFLIHPS